MVVDAQEDFWSRGLPAILIKGVFLKRSYNKLEFKIPQNITLKWLQKIEYIILL
jgi:hypothetical protein